MAEARSGVSLLLRQLSASSILLVAIGCQETMADYAESFSAACVPGEGTVTFLAGSVELPVHLRLSSAYRILSEEWTYQADAPGGDSVQCAEDLFSTSTFLGDCEDFGAALGAVCRSLNLRFRLVLAEGPAGGHSWLEVRLGSGPSYFSDRRILKSFPPEVVLAEREDGYWIQLDPFRGTGSLTPTHFIEASGELIELN